MEPTIIFQDESFFVLNKPSGWVVNRAKTTKNLSVVQDWIEKNLKFSISSEDSLRNGIVHRLDKETSGILLVAKNKKTFHYLQGQFKQRRVRKTYLTLVHGRIELKKDIIKAPVGRLPWNRERFGVLVGGKPAVTSYELQDHYSFCKDEYTLLQAHPKTGRTHQIRIHLKYLGYPVVSDEKYAGRKTARNDRKWCPRLFLHAYKMSLTHPEKKKRVEYKSDLPSDLQVALNHLKKEAR